MLAALTHVVLAATAASNAFVRLESDVAIHNSRTSSWVNNGAAPREEMMTLTVALTIDAEQRDKLEAAFWAVSTPTKVNTYRQFLNKDDLKNLLAVPTERVERVKEYFLSSGASDVKVSPYNDMLTVSMRVAEVERALATRISAFAHNERTGFRLLRASMGYSVPASLAGDVSMVDLLQFPRLRSNSLVQYENPNLMVEGGKVGSGGNWPSSCDTPLCKGYVDPGVLGERYKVDVNETMPLRGSMAAAEFQGQYFETKDLETFTDACHVKVTVDKVIGGNVDRPGIEAMLDIEYMKAVSQGVPLTVIYSNTYSLLNWANELMALPEPTLINSVSYGNDEAQQTGVAYMESVNTAFMKAGTMGLSILFASGDQGVCGREGCGEGPRKRFKPDFPGGSPYHTSVGGTDFYGTTIGEETAWRSGGGGFSDTFPIPAYQKDAVASYKKDLAAAGLLPDASLYNDTGRGYPDVAALGGTKDPYCINIGRWAGVAGTSAACPVVSAIFARLNSILLAKGKPPLGFLNPFIYAHPEAFQDVTHGINSDTQTAGFTAIKGWDAATGWGTPNFEALKKIVDVM